jgi:hypothetical protein
MAKWTIERWIAVLAIVLATGAYVQVLRDTKERVGKLETFTEERLPKDYVPREIYNVERQKLSEAIDRLSKSLDKLYALEQETGEPAYVQRKQRMFDR